MGTQLFGARLTALLFQDQCDMDYCNDPDNAGQKYASSNTIYGYCQCSAGGTTFEYCPINEVFDATLLECGPSADVSIDFKCS